jgi:hypothetical protein
MLNETPSILIVAALLCSLAGCGGEDAGGGWAGSLTDSAGVTIVRNPAQPLVGAAGAPAVEEVLRIGTTSGGSGTQFGLIASIAVAADGAISVLDRQESRVLRFARDGEFLGAVGRAGAGPGELSPQAVNVFVTPADTLLVADPGNLRINIYSPAGDAIGSIPVPSPTGTIPIRFAMMPDGRIVQHMRTMPTPEHPELRDDLLVALGRDGQVLDTLHRMPAGRSIRFRNGVAQFAAYEPEPVWALGRDGQVLSGTSGRYRIEERSKDGELRRVIEREHTSEAITDADRRAFLRMIRQQMVEQNVDPATIGEIVDGMSFADRYPAFAHFVAGPESTLWVQHVRSARQEGEAFDAQQIGSDRWDIFDADGRFLAETRMPPRFTPLISVDDRFYGIWSDSLDVQHVMVVRVTGPLSAAAVARGSSAT